MPKSIHVYYDVNFIDCLSKKRDAEVLANFNNELKRIKIVKKGTLVNHLATPFLMLEAIGLEDIPHPSPQIEVPKKLATLEKTREFYEYLYTATLDFFSNQIELAPSSLIEKARRQKMHLSEQGEAIFEIYVDNNFRRGFERSVYTQLTWDYVCKYDYPKKILRKAHMEIAISILDSIETKQNISSARIVKKMWDQMMAKPREGLAEADRDRIKKAMRQKNHKDYVDNELIHFAVVGCHHQGKLHPVHCFTTDSADKVRDRAFAFKAVFQFLSDTVRDAKRDGLKTRFKKIPKCKNGMIHVCDKRGIILESINVGSLDSLKW
jgi:hypothetical protein